MNIAAMVESGVRFFRRNIGPGLLLASIVLILCSPGTAWAPEPPSGNGPAEKRSPLVVGGGLHYTVKMPGFGVL